MNVGLVNINSALTNGNSALQSARTNSENAKFSELLAELQKKQNEQAQTTVSSSQIVENGRLNGDFSSGFSNTYSSALDKNARPTGAAANQANPNVKAKTIDKTSKLYEKSMELENYFVKQMLSEMRKTILKSDKDNYAQNMYEDMLYDEYSTAMTKNAGFGLADQIYLSLTV